MKNRLYLVLGVLVVAAVAVALAVLPVFGLLRPLPPEPVYDGKPLSFWLNAHPDFLSGQLPCIAQQILATSPSSIIADSNAVPFLIKALMTDIGFGAAWYRNWLWLKLPASLQKRLPRPRHNPLICMHAAAVLASMGPMAEPAVPALVRTLKRSKNSEVREFAVLALYNVGPGDKGATEALVKALKDNDDTLRQSVTNALLEISREGAATFGVKYSFR
jgi:hypothetical protein